MSSLATAVNAPRSGALGARLAVLWQLQVLSLRMLARERAVWRIVAAAAAALVAARVLAFVSLGGQGETLRDVGLAIVRLAVFAYALVTTCRLGTSSEDAGCRRMLAASPLPLELYVFGRYLGLLGGLCLALPTLGLVLLGLLWLGDSGVDLTTPAGLAGEGLLGAVLLAFGLLFGLALRPAAAILALTTLFGLALASGPLQGLMDGIGIGSRAGLVLLGLIPAPETAPPLSSPAIAGSDALMLDRLGLTALQSLGYVLGCLALACVGCLSRGRLRV